MDRVAGVGLCASLLIAFLGFVGISADNTQYLIGAHKLHDPGFLPMDWFTQHTTSFHPVFERFMVIWLAAGTPVLGLALWFLVNAIGLSYVVLIGVRHFSEGGPLKHWLALPVAAVILITGVNEGWGQYQILTGQALPAYLAYVPALASIFSLWRRRYLTMGVALCCTTWLHHGLGALMLILISCASMTSWPRNRIEYARLLLALGAAAMALLPLVLSATDLDGVNKENFRIFFYGRSPHHYAPQFSAGILHIKSLFIVASAILLATALPNVRLRRQYLGFVAIVVAGCALGYVFLELWYVPSLVRLFPFRAIPVLVVLNACAATALLFHERARSHTFLAGALATSATVAFDLSPVIAVALLLSAAGALALPRSLTVKRAASASTTNIVICIVLLGALGHKRMTEPATFFNTWPAPIITVLRDAFDTHTPVNATVVVPPWLTGVRIGTGRATVVTLKTFPVFASQMPAWANRVLDLTGIDPRDAKDILRAGGSIWNAYAHGYQNQGFDTLTEAARKYGAEFIVVFDSSRFRAEAKTRGVEPLWSLHGLSMYSS